MARALPVSQFNDNGQQAQSGDWQDLRSELMTLLDQVETRYAEPGRDAGASDYDGLARRVDDLRRQVGEPAGSRRREALASVKRAVDRFHEAAEPDLPPAPPTCAAGNPRDVLQSAIREIRARQQPQAAAPAAPALDDLVRSVGGLTSRLAQVEGEIRMSRQQGGDVREVADQVTQLTQVVELLAGAVGETGQVKRLEVQIAELGAMLETHRPDISDVTGRLDELAQTVDRLADIQIQHFGRDSKEGPTRAEALQDGMNAVEQSVRNVYDRIDAIERNLGAPSPEIERLTETLATFTQAMNEKDAGPDRLLPLVESLHERMAAFEGQGAGALRADIGALRSAVVEAMEPRFSAIEQRIEALDERLGEGRIDPATAGLEAQIRQLVNRMDQTGEQLASLAKLNKDERGQPDMEELASLVARKTSEAVGRAAPPDDIAGMRSGISKVDERLERLEAALARLDHGSAPRADAAMPARPSIRIPGPPESGDDMPSNPGDDRPLIDKGPAALAPMRPAREETSRRGVAEARAELAAAAEAPPAAPRIDPDLIARPPRPASAFDDTRRDPFADAPEPEAPEEPALDGPAMSSRNTFIEAARRAAQRQAAAKQEPAANSLIGRALSRFQPDAEAAPKQAPAVEEAPKKKPKMSRRQRAEAKAAAVAAAEAETVAPPEPAIASDEEEAPQGFLSRYRRPILLAAALVAVSFLTLNLVAQRLAPADKAAAPEPAVSDTIAPPATPAPAGTAPPPATDDAVPDKAAVVPDSAITLPATDSDGIDDLTVGAIDPDAAMNFTDPGDTAVMPPLLRAASLDPAVLDPEPLASPVKVEPPPEALGPAELRDAAANGDARAQFEVAAIYTEGRAVPQDLAAAAKWYERAAAQGFVPAEYRLGSLYEAGKGVDKDMEQARLWYQRAAEAGNRMSMHNLAALYAGGSLGKQDFASAAEWFEQAAMRGLTDSQFNLGMLYARGLGVPQDFGKSYKWFALAAKTGDADAAKSRDDVAKSLSAGKLAALETEVDAWQPTAIDLPANFAPIGTWSDHFDVGQAITDKKVVEKVQDVLVRLGFDVGTPDGLTGPKTADAIKAFEHATGMSETGTVNPRLLAVLGSQPV